MYYENAAVAPCVKRTRGLKPEVEHQILLQELRRPFWRGESEVRYRKKMQTLKKTIYQLTVLWNESECGEETMREKMRRREIKTSRNKKMGGFGSPGQGSAHVFW
jgi:hypothetical protein